MARRLAAAFLLYGLLAVALLAINVPPFQNPDEPAHFLRAMQVADGGLLGTRFTTTWDYQGQRVWAGATSDPAVLRAWQPFAVLEFHPETRATAAMWAPRIHWTNDRSMLPFSNTAIDPPVFYLPSALGVLLGRASRMTVVQTLVTARLLTGAAAVAVAALAIATSGGAAPFLFAVLALPESLAVMASVSQDALMIACGALAGALMVRLLRWPDRQDGKRLLALVVVLVLVGTARTPNGALALLPLGLATLRWRSRLLAAASVALGVAAWAGVSQSVALTNFNSYLGADPPAQAAWLLAHPLRIPSLAWNSIAQFWPDYLDGFIGRIGWFDTFLPPPYHAAAWAMLGVATAAAMLGLQGRPIGAGSRLAVLAGVLLACAGVFAGLYLTGNPVGGPSIYGVQGRHLLPIALAGAALLPALGGTRWARLHAPLVLLVAAFPIVTLAVVMRAVVLRYYLG